MTMRKRTVAIIGVCLVAGFATLTDWQSAPPSAAPALIDTSMLRPGMTCKIGVDSPSGASANCARGFLGMVAEVTETEIVLDDAIYQVINETDFSLEVGTVRIPMTEVASIHCSWMAPLDDGTVAERIGVHFR
jgi:hypothetical protein